MSVFSTTKGVWPRPKNIGRRVFMSGVWGEDYSQPLSDGSVKKSPRPPG
jgi:hypothetical protein